MKCHICNTSLKQFLNLGKQPLANKYPTRTQIPLEAFFPLKVLFCEQCKNVQLGTMIPRARMFEDYYYLSSVNQGLVGHFEGLARSLAHAQFVVDIGSNDGILLRPLKRLGVQALGVDPSVNVGKLANDEGLTTLVSFFNAGAVARIKKKYGRPDVIVASSVFTHVDDPHQVIEDVKELLADGGKFIVEVEYIGNILKTVQFERFYLDRIFYFSLSSLVRLFELHGMYIADVREITPHGGSLRVTAKVGTPRVRPKRVALFLKNEARILARPVLARFAKRVAAETASLKARLVKYKKQGLRVAAYGAPARVATICNYGKIGPRLISYIVDDSPLKQGRLTPGTHIPIVSSTRLSLDRPDVLVVFAYEYFDDIKKKTGPDFRFLLPIPPREIR